MNIVFPLPRLLRPIVAAALVLAAVQPAAAQRAVTFSVPGAEMTQPVTVNNRGVIAGLYDSDAVWEGAFVRDADGTITTIELPDVLIFTNRMHLNASGTLVGTYVERTFVARGFIRTPDGTVSSFNLPGAGTTVLAGINDGGTMIGAYLDSTFTHGAGFLVTRGGTMVEITGDDPSDLYIPVAINNAGSILGLIQKANGTYVGMFARDARGRIARFDVPHEPSRPDVTRVEMLTVQPAAINAAGVGTGYYQYLEWAGDTLVSAGLRGFIRHADGTLESFAAPNSTIEDLFEVPETRTAAQGISNAGAIFGYQFNTLLRRRTGFMRSRSGAYTTIEVDGAVFTEVTGVSSSGLAIGRYQAGAGLPLLGFIVR
ncbi:MAG: hypothetical protein AB7O67_19765 [Vicinamibacterales bacterium]